MKRCCNTCKFGDFWRTATGRPKKAHAGRCTADVPAMVVPASVVINHYKQAIWPTQGENCTFWMAKVEAPAC